MNLGKYTVSITRVRDNQTVEFTEDFTIRDNSKHDWSDWQSTLVFMWAEGNYSCNCNRFLFFERALGKTEEEISKFDPNGDDFGTCDVYEKYKVNFIKDKDGKVLYEEN